MKIKLQMLFLFLLFWFGLLAAQGMERPNLIWARTTSETITLDGVLSESSWQDAESFHMKYGENTQFIPGSGFRQEQGAAPSDPTDVTFRFLVNGNTLYVAATVKDSSVGGGLFNRFDGFLMNVRDHSGFDHPLPSYEFFYGWVTEPWADPATGEVGASPGFFGKSPADRDLWDAVTVVDGVSNDDSTPDVGYTTEFMFNLTTLGYDVTKSEGDLIEYNVSVYDADWQWGADSTANPKFSGNRVWWQGPWGNASSYDVIRVYARPDVTVSSGNAPYVGPEITIPNGINHPNPVIDGKLDEPVWANIQGFDIRYGDDALRSSYPGVGPYRSGQFQPDVNGGKAAVVDPGDATVKVFFKGNMLYLGVDVRDQAVWGTSEFDLWDGIRFVINDRAVQNADMVLEGRTLTAVVDSLGHLMTADYLTTMIDSGSAKAALALKSGTTVNDFNDVDQGYSFEIAVDLTEMGYPVGLGDGILFFSATLFDGEKFDNQADNYGTRTWFFRESANPAAPAYAYMDYSDYVPNGHDISALERPNLIWARQTSEAITLDGQLNEAAWANAESFRMKYGENTQNIPGSGYRQEQGVAPSDPTDVTFKFLVNGNDLYLAASVQDSSVGGGLFNRFDGFLLNIRDHSGVDRPTPSYEFFYGWVTEPWADPATGEEGASPGFFGKSPSDRDLWDAVTLVNGISNNDATPDAGYTTEFKFNLSTLGYDASQSQGDIIEFNVSVYDADWSWGQDSTANPKFSGNRVWWEGPWGNASSYDVVRVYSRPDVTTNSGDVPEMGPELVFENGANFDDPVVDGKLNDAVWGEIEGFDIRYGDDELRNSYPGIGPYRSGQFQPEINGAKAAVVDPGNATVKAFFKGNMLYIGVDVQDQAVWGNSEFDLWDGIRFVINDRKVQNADMVLEGRTLTAVVDSLGSIHTADFLTTMIDSGTAMAAMSLKPNTTINDFNDVDEGYSFELAIDLTELGYPIGLGDGVLFFSATLFDGEKFDNAADNYGTRAWFFRESASPAAPAWTLMDANKMVGDVTALNNEVAVIPTKFEILGNYPNPFNPSTRIKFTMPEAGFVKLNVFNVLGRKVAELQLGNQPAGSREVQFTANRLSTGLYFYNLEYTQANKRQITKTQKMLLIK